MLCQLETSSLPALGKILDCFTSCPVHARMQPADMRMHDVQEEPAKEAEREKDRKEDEDDKGRGSLRKRGRVNGGSGGGGNASTELLAEAAVKKLNAVEPKLELAGQQLQFLAHREQVRAIVHLMMLILGLLKTLL